MTCDAIIEATIQVLLRDGAGRLTTTRVADRAGVSVGTLYQYFPDKRALVEAVRERYFGLMALAVETIVMDQPNDHPARVLDDALDAVLEMKRRNIELSRAFAELPRDPDRPDMAAEVVERFTAFVVPLVTNGGPVTDRARARVKGCLAALDGMLSYAVKNEPGWLSEPWFQQDAKALIRSVLA